MRTSGQKHQTEADVVLMERRIKEDVVSLVGQRISGFSVEFVEQSCRLRGIAPNFYVKQVAQTVAGRIAECRQVVNEIAVASRDALDRAAQLLPY